MKREISNGKFIYVEVDSMCVPMRRYRCWRINSLATTTLICDSLNDSHTYTYAQPATTRAKVTRTEFSRMPATVCTNIVNEFALAATNHIFLLPHGQEGGCVSFILISFSWRTKFSIKLVFMLFLSLQIITLFRTQRNGEKVI